MVTTNQDARSYEVGGIRLERPFKIRRLGHFGFNSYKHAEAVRFYTELFGFKVSDAMDMARRLSPEDQEELKDQDTNGYFMRHNTEHHTFVLFNKAARERLAHGAPSSPEITVNQITWQVGSLSEVVNGDRWFAENGQRVVRSGRDMPGSNWHTYLLDPDGHTNELYYGIEQVGWDGFSKPREMHDRGFRERPSLPQVSEQQEVQDALGKGVDLASGMRDLDDLPAEYDVSGVLLPRPFKVVRIGPVRLFVQDIDAAEQFYRQALGFELTEEVEFEGHRCLFLRAGTEHHSLALYPIALRQRLGLSDHSTCMSFGLQVADYAQLRDAVPWLKERGARMVEVPPELSPGVDYTAWLLDPEGHCLQLYYYMEQVGWDGKPRPADQRVLPATGEWPTAVDPPGDVFTGEAFLGPWA